jgi:hypothetical protein
MPAREKKTREELIALFMHEIRQYPDCDHVVRISIGLADASRPASPQLDCALDRTRRRSGVSARIEN